jgi:hypothetical protein
MKINKYFPFVFIYFFVNSVALPFGLTYTSLFAPIFYIWILLTREKEVLLPFLAVLFPFFIAHLFIVGVDQRAYYISLLNIVLVYISCQAVYTFFLVCNNPEKIFRQLLIINFVLCLLAAVLYFTPFYSLMWIEQEFTQGISQFHRMRMFTYEASYYATLFTPIFFFFFLQFLFGQNKIRNSWLLVMLLLPYLLSFSIGVMGCVLLSIFFTWIIYFSRLTGKRKVLNTIITGGAILGFALVIVVLFFRHNPLFTRMANIFEGQDPSGKGRTRDAFILAGQMLEQTNKYWGIGIGQIKVAGADFIRTYYLYGPEHPVALPNATAETLAIFGWIGLILRFSIEIFLFFYIKVWNNYYRLLLFTFIFLYQFTGSFITNIAEYVIWIIAFMNVFPQFDVRPYKRQISSQQIMA